ncbi:trans-aconitate 2-methyltransferase [Tropicimonas sp. IMCC34043]|uniref:class I SAM-dependent methyltransferase n=1 Tax=Tropicimonas sp. IMCC34043 TaxID=2248760 RepID=UPI000E2333A9|nr:class I SAM-dependent methyltransferase [Tropicimonas sp. IMCC34043]
MTAKPTGPDDVLTTYQRVGPAWVNERGQSLFERRWLERLMRTAPGLRVLDLGCGAGRPISVWLAGQGASVTGVDGAAAMCALFRANLPGHTCHHADMRGLSLGQRFDAILAWNSFFHLSAEDQVGMFPVFAAHAAPGAALMFTSGPAAGEAFGTVAGAPIYHASLAPEQYRALLHDNGFAVVDFVPEDPDCNGHTVWLARASVSDGS